MEKALRHLPVSGTVLAVGTLLVLLIYKGAPLDWSSGMALILIALFGFAVAATLRFAVGELFGASPVPSSAEGDSLLRGRLAPLVIGIGTVGILVVAVAALIGISVGRQQPLEPSVYLGVFSTVIPVFATWVGSVIAFYFSNESFRQAAQASGALKGDADANEPITSPNRMIPLDKITSIVLKGPKKHPAGSSEDLNKAPVAGDVYPDKAEDVEIADITWLLSNNTVSRLIIFDQNMVPVVIVRKKLILELPAGAKVEQYLAKGQNRADAVNFRSIPETATVGEARVTASVYKTADLFVTKSGRLDEPIKGWVPDDKLL
jgi:hypothetical protein